MKRVCILLIGTFTLLTLTACGAKKIPYSQRVRIAPVSDETTGLLVSGVTEADMARVAEKYPEMKVRIINPSTNEQNPEEGFFEVHNVSESALHQILGDKARIRPNRYLRLTRQPLKRFRDIRSLRSDLRARQLDKLEELSFLDGCLPNRAAAPIVVVHSEARVDQMEISRVVLRGETVKYNSHGSSSRRGGPVETLWLVHPAEFSKTPSRAYLGAEIEVTPDTTGEYNIVTVIKDQDGVCETVAEPLYVTANPKVDLSKAVTQRFIKKFDLTPFWQLFAIDATDSWQFSTGKNVTVAVIDTGVDYNHRFLSANMAVNKKEIPDNGIDDDNNGYVDDHVGYDIGSSDGLPFDDMGHGTHVAGIIGSPVFGIARDVKIMPVKVSAGPGMDVGSVAGGIFYAVRNGANVLNISLGFEETTQEMRDAIDYARSKGVVVVIAGGNGDDEGGVDLDQKALYPASYLEDNLINVAATDISGILTSYSNFGAKSMHVAAPGGDATTPIKSTVRWNSSKVELKDDLGTSMAAPIVSGVAAQVLSLRPDYSPTKVREVLMKSGTEQVTLIGKTVSGRIVNSWNAVRMVASEAEIAQH